MNTTSLNLGDWFKIIGLIIFAIVSFSLIFGVLYAIHPLLAAAFVGRELYYIILKYCLKGQNG